MLYTPRFFSSKCSLFHNANLFGSCIIHILYTGVLKLKKNNSGAKELIHVLNFYHNEFSTVCDLVLSLSTASVVLFQYGHPGAAYIFFLIFYALQVSQ